MGLRQALDDHRLLRPLAPRAIDPAAVGGLTGCLDEVVQGNNLAGLQRAEAGSRGDRGDHESANRIMR
jgi:hypothetical protein